MAKSPPPKPQHKPKQHEAQPELEPENFIEDVDREPPPEYPEPAAWARIITNVPAWVRKPRSKSDDQRRDE